MPLKNSNLSYFEIKNVRLQITIHQIDSSVVVTGILNEVIQILL